MSWNEVWPPLLGGSLIGVAAAGLLLLTGKTAGVSGVLEGVLLREKGEFAWKTAFVGGLLAGGLLLSWLRPGSFSPGPLPSWPWALAGGFCVGFGTRLGSGCTSGHGICGIGKLSLRSLAATAIFMGVGMLVRGLL